MLGLRPHVALFGYPSYMPYGISFYLLTLPSLKSLIILSFRDFKDERYLEVAKRLYRREMIESLTFEKSGVYLQNKGGPLKKLPFPMPPFPMPVLAFITKKKGFPHAKTPQRKRKKRKGN
jgi:hypothetical protein